MKQQTQMQMKQNQNKPATRATAVAPQTDTQDLLQLARQHPERLSPGQRSQLQRTLGNRTLSQLVGNRPSVHGSQSSSTPHLFTSSPGHPFALSPGHKTIQAKLTVNAVGDKYEQEADAVAKEVVQKLNAPQPDAASPALTQRQEVKEEDPAHLAMTQRQPQDFTNGGPVDSHIEAQINQSRGGGRPMEDSIRQPMEQAFDADFSDVRIHTDGRAHNLNEAIQARAFTIGNDIFFNEGEFYPKHNSDRDLLAHELVHTLQQENTIQRKKALNATRRWAVKLSYSVSAAHKGLGIAQATGKLKNRKTNKIADGYFLGGGIGVGLQLPGADPEWGDWVNFTTGDLYTFSDFDGTLTRLTTVGFGAGIGYSWTWLSFPLRGANSIFIKGPNIGAVGADASTNLGIWKLGAKSSSMERIKHAGSQTETNDDRNNAVIVGEPFIIKGNPNFYSKALRINKYYSKNVPYPGWPYKPSLHRFWQKGDYDEFAVQVRDIQEYELGLSGRGVDGILGPQTSHLMNNESDGKESSPSPIHLKLNNKEERMSYVMELLVNKYSYPENGAAGLVGNLYAESGLIANRIEGSKADTPMRAKNAQGHTTDFATEDVMNRKYNVQGPKKPGVGLAQWTTKNRREGLFKHKYEGVEQGANILFNLEAQVDYLITELRGKYKHINRILEDPSSSVSDASDEVLFNFERPAKVLKDVDGKKKLRSRDDPEIQGVLKARRKLGEDALGIFQEGV